MKEGGADKDDEEEEGKEKWTTEIKREKFMKGKSISSGTQLTTDGPLRRVSA